MAALSDESGKCVLSFWSPWEARIIHVGTSGTAARSGEDSPGGFGGGWEGGQHPAALQVPRSAHLGSRHYPERQKPQGLLKPGGTGHHGAGSQRETKRLVLAVPGRGRGQATLPGEEKGPLGHPRDLSPGKGGEHRFILLNSAAA